MRCVLIVQLALLLVWSSSAAAQQQVPPPAAELPLPVLLRSSTDPVVLENALIARRAALLSERERLRYDDLERTGSLRGPKVTMITGLAIGATPLASFAWGNFIAGLFSGFNDRAHFSHSQVRMARAAGIVGGCVAALGASTYFVRASRAEHGEELRVIQAELHDIASVRRRAKRARRRELAPQLSLRRSALEFGVAASF